MLKGVSTVYLFVAEIRPSRDWYEQVLGYPPEEDLDDFVLFKIGRTNLCLHRADAKPPLSTGGAVAYWEVDDFDGAVQHFLAHGGPLHRGPINAVDGIWICQIRDPFGNVIGLEGRKRDLPDLPEHEESLLGAARPAIRRQPSPEEDWDEAVAEAAAEEFRRKLEAE